MELSRQSGIAQGTINRLENEPNPNPKMHNLVKLARALGVSVDRLIGEDAAEVFVDRIAALEKRVRDLERARGKQ
ncbi:MAG: Cro/C1-type DNA-binding domain [Candidatus Eremiobacteraeota bacterium]|nr:Cro/C1-type DNA-binding domain [Candidatus Eremiobacteraeota bacterium]